jgi:hypothetical protein
MHRTGRVTFPAFSYMNIPATNARRRLRRGAADWGIDTRIHQREFDRVAVDAAVSVQPAHRMAIAGADS